MAIVNVNSISGINSITAQSGSLNFFTAAGNNLPITAATLNVGTGASVSSPATNVLTLGTNNVESVRINSSGAVGLGTANPQERLHNSITANNQNYLRLDNPSGTSYYGLNSSGDTEINAATNNNIIFKTFGTERSRINSSGNVGIGLTNPDEILCVTKNSPDPFNTVSTHLKLINAGGNQGAGNRIQFVTGAATAWIQSLVSGANSANGSDLVFGTPSTGTVGTERLRINSSGHTLPGADNTYDLGASGTRWRNIYTADLQMSNEGFQNDIDGTWGKYTIQEGENDLFLINRRTGKRYKFLLEEVK